MHYVLFLNYSFYLSLNFQQLFHLDNLKKHYQSQVDQECELCFDSESAIEDFNIIKLSFYIENKFQPNDPQIFTITSSNFHSPKVFASMIDSSQQAFIINYSFFMIISCFLIKYFSFFIIMPIKSFINLILLRNKFTIICWSLFLLFIIMNIFVTQILRIVSKFTSNFCDNSFQEWQTNHQNCLRLQHMYEILQVLVPKQRSLDQSQIKPILTSA